MQTLTQVDVVAIDGPVGVGKSSVARTVARELGFVFLDTGAMYRAVTLRFLEAHPSSRDAALLERIARDLSDLEIHPDGSVWLGSSDISQDIRDEEVSRHVYLAADHMGVRAALVDQQRRLGAEAPSVLEGRDISTVVFPRARWKFYLDASPRVRVERRVAQLQAMGKQADPGEIHRNLVERDHRDRNREWGALAIADDATVVDTTGMAEQQVIGLIVASVRAGH